MYLDRLVILAIAGYALLDAVRRRYLPLQREIYALIAVLIIVLVLVQLYRSRKLPLSLTWAGLAALILVVFSVKPLDTRYFDIAYYVGDLMILAFLLALLLAIRVLPALFASRTNHAILLSFLAVAMFAAPLIQMVSPANDQIVPPHLLLMAATWAGVAVVRDPRVRLLLAGLLLIELFLSYFSEQRTNVVLWLAFGVMVVLLRSTIRQKTAAFFGILVISIVMLGVAEDLPRKITQEVGSSLIADSRFELLQEGPDESLLGRYLEVRDVWLNMTNDWTTLDWILGAGHGATFRPFYWYPERNMKRGRTHNIHFGPMLVFYRYGITGFVIFILFAAYAGIAVLRHGPRYARNYEGWWALTVSLACIGAILTFLLFNALQDPVIAFTIAAFFHTVTMRDSGRFTSGAPAALQA